MKITNLTNWRTDLLAALIRRVAQDELTPEQVKTLHVTVKWHKANWIGGYARYNSTSMALKLPRTDTLDPVEVAAVIAHEMAHCRGLHHRQMKGNRYQYKPGWRDRYRYAAEYPLERKPVTVKRKPGDEQKFIHCLVMVTRWKTKVKRAATGLRQWTRKARYYEKKMAAKARP
jgi:hypothetical protein